MRVHVGISERASWSSVFKSAGILALGITLFCFRADSKSAFADGGTAVVPSTVKTQFTDANGQVQTITTTVTRSDGSQAVITEQAGARGALRTVRFASGKMAIISNSSREKSTVFDPARTPSQWLRDPTLNCVRPATAKESFVGVEMVEGYRTAKVVLSPRTTGWFALDYSCAELQYTAPWSKTDVHFFRLVSLTAGDPSADWFAIPSDYKEVPPSELFGSAKDTDEYYYAHRPH